VQGSWIQGWLRASINLAALQDQNVKLRFRVDDDWGRQGRAQIDNVAFTNEPFTAFATDTYRDPFPINEFGWSMKGLISPNDGLKLSDVALGYANREPRYMAKEISLPYFTLMIKQADGTILGPQRFELKPDSTGPGRSVLTGFERGNEIDPTTRQHLTVVEATYKVDQLFPGSSSAIYRGCINKIPHSCNFD